MTLLKRIIFDRALTVMADEMLEVDDREARVIGTNGYVKSISKVRNIMGRPALVIPKVCLPPHLRQEYPYPRTVKLEDGIEEWLYAQHPVLADRDHCEMDESLLQLLPYVTLAAVLPGQPQRYFAYRRGQKGAESRLHGAISLGIGGHIDVGPSDTVPLPLLLQHEVAREVQEETGYILSAEVKFTHLILDWTNPVGRVHMGIHGVIELTRQEDVDSVSKDSEPGIINEGAWMTFDELVPRQFYSMENWTRAVTHLLAGRR